MTDRIKDLEHIEPVAAARAKERFDAAAWPDETLTEIGGAAMAFSQAISLKRIADAVTANTEQHDRVESSMDAFIEREADMLERIAVALERLTERLTGDVDSPDPAGRTAARATPAPDADSWTPWSGGANPAPGRAVVILLRDPDANGTGSPFSSNALRWNHYGTPGDIVAYRIHKD